MMAWKASMSTTPITTSATNTPTQAIAVPPAASRHADQDAGQEDQQAADDHLDQGGSPGRVHEAVADPGDDEQLHQHDAGGDAGGDPVAVRHALGNEVRQAMADAAQAGHE